MTQLAVHEAGLASAPAVVLLHGVGNDGTMWRSVMDGLPEYHCLAPDLPGHGQSRPIPWRTRQHTATQLAKLIEDRAGGKAHVVGLSLGGSVALQLLATRPDVLDHVIVDGCSAIGSPLIGPMKLGVAAISPFLRFASVARLIGRAFGVAPGPGMDDFVGQITTVDSRSFRRAFADANDVRITPRLLAAPCRTLLVAGENELRHVRVSNQLLAERMPNAEALVVPNAGHGWGSSTSPDLHLAMVRAWLADVGLPDGLGAETISDTAAGPRQGARRSKGATRITQPRDTHAQ